MRQITKQDVLARLHQIYEGAVQNYRSGVSYILSEEEQSLIDEADIEQIKVETGYNAMCDGYSALGVSDAEAEAIRANNN